jgi:hydroxypyruvate isomerase
MSWSLRYAAHLGYRSASPRPLFAESAESLDAPAQIAYAAQLGFAGMQVVRAVSQTKAQRNATRAALERYGLETGGMLYAEQELLRSPLWGTSDAGAQERRERALRDAFDVAREINGRYIMLLSTLIPGVPRALQHVALVENLKRAAELAARHDVVLLLEGMSLNLWPDALVARIDETYAVVRAVDHPNVRLVFDVGHVQCNDGNLIANLRAVWDAVALVQVADNPGRLEPGTGEINIGNVLRTLHELGYSGLVELEHDWSQPTRACEQRGIEYLRSIDPGAA